MSGSTSAAAHSGGGGHGSSSDGTLFGHPTCLFTLFFAEMWERFSFYGMKALLILYMVNYLFWRQDEASHVMALYAGFVYATPVLGGLIADKITGARWAVVIGGVIIATGHFLLAFEPLAFFYSGLICLVIGTGFLKPNISTQVGALYRSADERRDSAFTIFYMGINLGAFIGPLVCGWLRLNYGWHYGFAAAGVGMVIGLIVYIAGMGSVVRRERIIAAEEAAAGPPDETGRSATPSAPEHKHGEPALERPGAGGRGVSMSRIYLDRSIVLIVICVFAILFWVGFEQAANVMNLWADKHTNLHVFRDTAPEAAVALGDGGSASTAPATGPAGAGAGDFQLTAEMTQSINPFFIITLAAVFAWLWQFLQKRGMQPSTPMKMALGVFFLSLAYGVMLLAAQAESKRTTAPLASLPPGISVDKEGRVYSTPLDGESAKPEYFGATRLRWADGALEMHGVLTDLDWMRALGASADRGFARLIDEIRRQADARAEEVRQAKLAGTMPRDATWEIATHIPEELGDIQFIAGLSESTAAWDAGTRTLTVKATLSDKDVAQILAGGAEPQFRAALTQIYKQSSVLKISIIWLLAFYCVLTIGELCLSPVGLSLVTKAAPPKYVGFFMGFWFFTTGAVSNYLAHFAGGYWGTMTPAEYFMIFGVIGAVATIIMLLMLRVLRPMLHGIH